MHIILGKENTSWKKYSRISHDSNPGLHNTIDLAQILAPASKKRESSAFRVETFALPDIRHKSSPPSSAAHCRAKIYRMQEREAVYFHYPKLGRVSRFPMYTSLPEKINRSIRYTKRIRSKRFPIVKYLPFLR